MQGNSKKQEQSPADIAREVFRRLALQRIAPTPDAYRTVYDEIAGVAPHEGAERVLSDFAADLAAVSDSAAPLSARLAQAVQRKDWHACAQTLSTLVEQQLRPAARAVQPSEPAPAPPRRGSAISLVDEVAAARATDGAEADALRDLLARALTLGVAPMMRSAPDLAEEAESLAAAVRDPDSGIGMNEIGSRLKQLCFKIELRSEDMAEEHELLLRLFRLLLENVGELLEDDSWLTGQIESVQRLLAGPLSHATLQEATRNLKEVIYKQGALKHSLAEAKLRVKNMMITFIDRLGSVAASTGDYHARVGMYSEKIGKAKNIVELNTILDEVMQDTRTMQTEALRSRDEMVAAREEVQQAEAKIQELESKLEELSELALEDGLTGSLNRRGLDDAFEREMARAERRKSPLCVALLDLDDFKRLNDTYGHSAGDGALKHLVQIIKDTLRSMDVVGRFGGEEFLIVLPDTDLPDAVRTITRLQRELTKRIFMHDNSKVLITFSAGVALRAPGEAQAALVGRADAALYKAKRTGKNRVVVAQ